MNNPALTLQNLNRHDGQSAVRLGYAQSYHHKGDLRMSADAIIKTGRIELMIPLAAAGEPGKGYPSPNEGARNAYSYCT